MESYLLDNLEITVDKPGANRFAKVSYPIRYGRFWEIKTPEYLFQFNLNGEIKYIRGFNDDWPHPAEWLKRTDANDWVYYSAGEYNELLGLLGEYYRPCLPYPSNSIWKYNPFIDSSIQRALAAWPELIMNFHMMAINGMPSKIKKFLLRICGHDAQILNKRSEKLHGIIGGRLSVLPPDTRHVDYEVIPLMIADGCRYHCDFCCIKSHQGFYLRPNENILQQIQQLKSFYGANLVNYNALFLGNHDALAAGRESICMSVDKSYAAFGFENSNIKNPSLFLFGSVDSLLNAGNSLIEALNQLPVYTYINIGLESVDDVTLTQLNKPLEIQKIENAFEMMLDVNRSYPNVEITANALLGDQLRPEHYQSLIDLVRNRLDRFYSKGAIYLSPLMNSRDHRKLLQTFVEIKKLSRLPTYLYLIQRL